MKDLYIPILFHNEPIGLPVIGKTPLGHAGVIIVNGTTGEARYYEYGRYDGTGGIVKERTVSNLDVTSRTELTSSVVNAIKNLSQNRGKASDIYFDVIPVESGSYATMNSYAQAGITEINKYGTWTPWNSCYTFTKNVGLSVGVDLSKDDKLWAGDTLDSLQPSMAAVELYNNRGGVFLTRSGEVVSYRVPPDSSFLAGPLSASQLKAIKSIHKDCFLAGTMILMADGTEKPIEEVKPGDLVMAFDASSDGGQGALVARPVTRTFQNTTDQIINLRGLKCTPGHVFLTGETDAQGNGIFRKISEILKEDGTILNKDGTIIRARTGAPVGSTEDTPILVVYSDPERPGTQTTVLVRAGIPCIFVTYADTGKRALWSLAQALAANGIEIMPNGHLRNSDGSISDATDWPPNSTPFNSGAQSENWILRTADTSLYTHLGFLPYP